MTKRAFDILFSSFGLMIALPIIVLVCVLNLFFLGPPIFFRQSRLGFRGHEFSVIKFRTMHSFTDHQGILLEDSVRRSNYGNFLRRMSIDEVPSLWLVLRGKMSMVGPRPLPSKYRERYTRSQFVRHEVLPGVTGLAQVRGRKRCSWRHKLMYDRFYVKNRSLGLDLFILKETICVVMSGVGADQLDEDEMPDFNVLGADK